LFTKNDHNVKHKSNASVKDPTKSCDVHPTFVKFWCCKGCSTADRLTVTESHEAVVMMMLMLLLMMMMSVHTRSRRDQPKQ